MKLGSHIRTSTADSTWDVYNSQIHRDIERSGGGEKLEMGGLPFDRYEVLVGQDEEFQSRPAAFASRYRTLAFLFRQVFLQQEQEQQ